MYRVSYVKKLFSFCLELNLFFFIRLKNFVSYVNLELNMYVLFSVDYYDFFYGIFVNVYIFFKYESCILYGKVKYKSLIEF